MVSKIREKLLYSKLARKNKDAFDEFYSLYIDKIYQYIFYKVNSKEDAEDLTSAFFLKIWGCIQEGKIDDFKTFKPFCYTVARNLVIDHYRKLNQRKTVSLDQEINRELEDDKIDGKSFLAENKADSMEQLAKAMELDLIKFKLFELKDEYREIIVLKYIEELSPKEIAAILQKSKGNVNVLAHRALKALKDIMEKEEVKNKSEIRNKK